MGTSTPWGAPSHVVAMVASSGKPTDGEGSCSSAVVCSIIVGGWACSTGSRGAAGVSWDSADGVVAMVREPEDLPVREEGSLSQECPGEGGEGMYGAGPQWETNMSQREGGQGGVGPRDKGEVLCLI